MKFNKQVVVSLIDDKGQEVKKGDTIVFRAQKVDHIGILKDYTEGKLTITNLSDHKAKKYLPATFEALFVVNCVISPDTYEREIDAFEEDDLEMER